MSKKIDISASIVLHNENLEELQATISCFLKVPLSKKLYLIDNTKNARFYAMFSKIDNNEIEYIPNYKNLGFGRAHNLILQKIKNYSSFHLILNPDVTFEQNIIPKLIDELKNNPLSAMIAPKVVFPNKKMQYSCRRYPSPKELIVRRLGVLKQFFKKIILKGQYHDIGYKNSFNPEYLTGCFHLYKTEDFVAIEGFDERYFLYMEDVDICKKIDAYGKDKIYYPSLTIKHTLKQGSSKKAYLFIIHLISAIKYFKKWGIS